MKINGNFIYEYIAQQIKCAYHFYPIFFFTKNPMMSAEKDVFKKRKRFVEMRVSS